MSTPQSAGSSSAYHMDLNRRGRVVIVKLAGSVNMDVCDEVRDRLIEIVDEEPTENLILDLSELKFICSVGLGGIIAAHVRCRHHNGGVKLVRPMCEIRELLNVTKLTKLFAIYESLDEAIAT